MAEDLDALQDKLDVYLTQKSQLDAALLDDPRNEELQQLRDSLLELITMAEDMIDEAVKERRGRQQGRGRREAAVEEDEEEEDRLLDLHLAGRAGGKERVEERQEMRFEKGMSCKAMWSEDGQWYEAVVTDVSPAEGAYTVLFSGYGNSDTVSASCIVGATEALPANAVAAGSLAAAAAAAGASALSAASESSGGNGSGKRDGGSEKTGKAAGGSKKGKADAVVNPNAPIAIPPGLIIQETDTEDVKARKKKKLHIYKGTMRRKQLEAVTQQKQNSWKSFLSSSKRKKGTFTNVKKKSIFASSVDGRIGFTGSGQGMTTFQERKVGHKKTKTSLPDAI